MVNIVIVIVMWTVAKDDTRDMMIHSIEQTEFNTTENKNKRGNTEEAKQKQYQFPLTEYI